MLACILAYLHSCIIPYLYTYILDYLYTCVLAYLHTCILAYLHTCIHAYLFTCIQLVNILNNNISFLASPATSSILKLFCLTLTLTTCSSPRRNFAPKNDQNNLDSDLVKTLPHFNPESYSPNGTVPP